MVVVQLLASKSTQPKAAIHGNATANGVGWLAVPHRLLKLGCLRCGQIRKEDDELNTAFGTSSIQQKIKALQDHKNPQGKTTAIMLFGSARECENAQVLAAPSHLSDHCLLPVSLTMMQAHAGLLPGMGLL